jgi:SAM-dependent methyltransferase
MIYDCGIQPGDTVYDLGCGIGRIGFMVRDLTDHAWGNFATEDWKVNLFGVDIWEPYIKELQKAIYTDIYLADILDFLLDLQFEEKAKLSILSHVLEHMPHAKGMECIERARRKSEWVIACVPLGNTPQEPVFGNENEAHISCWELSDFQKIAERIEVDGRGMFPTAVVSMRGLS